MHFFLGGCDGGPNMVENIENAMDPPTLSMPNSLHLRNMTVVYPGNS